MQGVKLKKDLMDKRFKDKTVGSSIRQLQDYLIVSVVLLDCLGALINTK